jgi:protein-tyrosine-phosphatase
VAEIYLKQLLKEKNYVKNIHVISRGIQGSTGTTPPKHKNITQYPLEWSITKPILEKLRVNTSSLNRHKAKPITMEVMKQSSVIFAMDQIVLKDLLAQFPTYKNKLRLFTELIGKREDIPDCGGSSKIRLHRYVNERIIEIIKRGFDNLISQ